MPSVNVDPELNDIAEVLFLYKSKIPLLNEINNYTLYHVIIELRWENEV